MELIAFSARALLVVVLLVSGIAKLFDREGTEDAMSGFGVPDRLIPASARSLPWIELGLALGLLFAPTVTWAAAVVAIMFLGFAAVMIRVVMADEILDCHCFGQLSSGPVSWWTVARNGALTLGSGFVSWWSLTHGSEHIWQGVTWVSALAILIVAVIASLAMVIWRQRIMIAELADQIDEITALVPRHRLPSPSAEDAYSQRVVDVMLTDQHGTQTPAASLHQSRKPALLIFVSSSCRACSLLLPHVAQWQQEFSGKMPISVIGWGDTEALVARCNELGLDRIYIRSDNVLVETLGLHGQPTAVLVDHDGFIRQKPIMGRDNIGGLVAALRTEAGLT